MAMLGMVSPTAVGWLTTRAERSGLNAGLVLAASTVASFAGTIVTAFYLLRLSVTRMLTISGIVLAAVGLALLLCSAVRTRGRTPPREGGEP